MKGTILNTIIIILLSTILYSCAAVFLPNKQKVTITTGSKDAEIYVDNVKLGEGKTVTGKVAKGSVSQVVVKYGDDYLQTNEVLIPSNKRVPAYYFLQVLNIPVCFTIYGLYTLVVDARVSKAYPFAKELKLDAPRKLYKKAEDAKYMYLTNIRLDIEDSKKDILWHNGDYKGDLKASMGIAEAIHLKDIKKGEEKEAKKKSKGKKIEYLDEEEKKDIKYEDVIFTDKLMKNLYDGGFVDTVNNIFSDNNNTLVLEGKIDKIDLFRISPNNSWSSGNVYKTRTSLVWYIKNTYGEVLDSVATDQYSESFAYYHGDDMMKKTVGSCVELSFFELLENDKFKKYSKIETDLNPKNAVTKLNKPKSPVTKKQDAADASVIVKTKKGHGSGFAITNDGYVITNYHVISGAKNNSDQKITIINSEGDEMEAEVVKCNKYRDVALLKVEGKFSKAFSCSSEKSFAKMHDVYTIGAPKSIELGQSISVGIISNERKINNNNLLQLNMSINSGNSGGPIFDSEGRLHGVAVSKLIGKNTEGVSFAIPGYLLNEYLNLQF